MTVNVQDPPDTGETVAHLPADTPDDNWVRPGDAAGAPVTVAELRATYGTADPVELAAAFALDEDVATARALAGAR
ncbi:hypothetical protein E1211_30535 [Micromonospora sp. 15K316]|uniref:hypothetical protein n=1 Tax=Micromonospora sp. 15K316 TaxID=2530376 RepID=UPI001044C8C9|nr:hypothetical protein [Micromonospora sp. 15K316]TDC25945.1 hypothetical protein E1211_30535 [Micromonospora sp. 15K316]